MPHDLIRCFKSPTTTGRRGAGDRQGTCACAAGTGALVGGQLHARSRSGRATEQRLSRQPFSPFPPPLSLLLPSSSLFLLLLLLAPRGRTAAPRSPRGPAPPSPRPGTAEPPRRRRRRSRARRRKRERNLHGQRLSPSRRPAAAAARAGRGGSAWSAPRPRSRRAVAGVLLLLLLQLLRFRLVAAKLPLQRRTSGSCFLVFERGRGRGRGEEKKKSNRAACLHRHSKLSPLSFASSHLGLVFCHSQTLLPITLFFSTKREERKEARKAGDGKREREIFCVCFLCKEAKFFRKKSIDKRTLFLLLSIPRWPRSSSSTSSWGPCPRRRTRGTGPAPRAAFMSCSRTPRARPSWSWT